MAFLLCDATVTKISQQVGIVISNLVIGLTVNEAEEVFKTALSMRLERAMSQILGIEGLLLKDSALTRRFRTKLEERTQMRSYLNSSNVGGYKICIKPYELKSWKRRLGHPGRQFNRKKMA